jgi:hypothetical protein
VKAFRIEAQDKASPGSSREDDRAYSAEFPESF